MTTRWTFAVVMMAILLLFLVIGRLPADSVKQEPSPAPQLATTGSVRVQHTLLAIDPVVIPFATAEEPGRPSPSRTLSASASPSTPPARATRPVVSQPGLVARAKKAFFGDGRHRPEPFPRVKDN